MPHVTMVELRELLETAYIKGWDDSQRHLPNDEYLTQKKAAIDAMMENL